MFSGGNVAQIFNLLYRAVSQNCILLAAADSKRVGVFLCRADCKSVIQQIENLRYAKQVPSFGGEGEGEEAVRISLSEYEPCCVCLLN